MKKIISLAFLFSISGLFFANAQEQLKHDPVNFVSEEGHLYVNKTLPFYLRLSSSPDKNAENFLLKSESAPKYSNPFYFDTEGKNTVRTPVQVDPVTRKIVHPIQDVIFEVYADGLAPISSGILSGGRTFYKSGTRFYGKGLIFKIKARDAVSGVAKTYISKNGAAFSEYTKELEFEKSEKVTLKYYSVDRVGNAEKVKTLNFTVDVAAPEVKQSYTGDALNGVLGTNAKIVLEATDNFSGVNRIVYTVDGRNPQIYKYPISVSLFSGGDHKINYYAIDNVGNSNADDDDAMADFMRDFLYDNVGPQVTISEQQDVYKGKYTYISERTKISMSSTDKNSEIIKQTYGIDASASSNKYTDAFNVTGKLGLRVVRAMAEDKMNNNSKVAVKTYYLDNKAPSTGINYGTPKFFSRDTLFINPSTPISFKSYDTGSGVQKEEYSINGAAFQTYTEKFKLEKEGYYNIKFKATDKVNNVETIKESNVFVDNSSPEIYINFSIENIRTETVDGKTLSVYPKYTKMYLSATDRYTGEESIYFSINGGKRMRYLSAKNIADLHLISKEGNYKVKILSKDKLGNESEKEVEFIISAK